MTRAMIELTRLKCKWKVNQKWKGTDDTPIDCQTKSIKNTDNLIEIEEVHVFLRYQSAPLYLILGGMYHTSYFGGLEYRRI